MGAASDHLNKIFDAPIQEIKISLYIF